MIHDSNEIITALSVFEINLNHPEILLPRACATSGPVYHLVPSCRHLNLRGPYSTRHWAATRVIRLGDRCIFSDISLVPSLGN